MSEKKPLCYCGASVYNTEKRSISELTVPHDPRYEKGCEWWYYVMDSGRYCEVCEYYHEWQEGHPYGETTAFETLWECRQDDPMKCPYFIDQMDNDEED